MGAWLLAGGAAEVVALQPDPTSRSQAALVHRAMEWRSMRRLAYRGIESNGDPGSADLAAPFDWALALEPLGDPSRQQVRASLPWVATRADHVGGKFFPVTQVGALRGELAECRLRADGPATEPGRMTSSW